MLTRKIRTKVTLHSVIAPQYSLNILRSKNSTFSVTRLRVTNEICDFQLTPSLYKETIRF